MTTPHPTDDIKICDSCESTNEENDKSCWNCGSKTFVEAEVGDIRSELERILKQLSQALRKHAVEQHPDQRPNGTCDTNTTLEKEAIVAIEKLMVRERVKEINKLALATYEGSNLSDATDWKYAYERFWEYVRDRQKELGVLIPSNSSKLDD